MSGRRDCGCVRAHAGPRHDRTRRITLVAVAATALTVVVAVSGCSFRPALEDTLRDRATAQWEAVNSALDGQEIDEALANLTAWQSIPSEHVEGSGAAMYDVSVGGDVLTAYTLVYEKHESGGGWFYKSRQGYTCHRFTASPGDLHAIAQHVECPVNIGALFAHDAEEIPISLQRTDLPLE